MAVNVYEGMYILDANRYARDVAAVSGQIPEMIQKLGGEILASRLWEERRLAYAIDGHRKGTYWLTYFKLESGELANLSRQCQLSDSILRTLFLKVDPRIADALVSHALTGGTMQRRAAAEPPAAVTAVDKDEFGLVAEE
ncbi:MAG: 30S ribosomal protein S6 [Pirellulales bacterium]